MPSWGTPIEPRIEGASGVGVPVQAARARSAARAARDEPGGAWAAASYTLGARLVALPARAGSAAPDDRA